MAEKLTNHNIQVSYSKPSSHNKTFHRILDPEILTFWGLWSVAISCKELEMLEVRKTDIMKLEYE